MDFTFTDDQIAFREAVSRFLMTEAAPETLREIWETDTGRSPALRAKIAQQGLTALSVPEACGGLGMDDVAWALMTREIGYYGLPDSLADTAYVATGLLAALPRETPRRDELLGRIADGGIRIAVGHPIHRFVPDGHPADLLLLAEGDAVHAVERSAVKVDGVGSMDLSRRLARVQWTPTPQTCLARGETGRRLWDETLDRGALSCAGQLLGLAQRMLDLSVDYAAQRKQFGKAIGSFQAVKHALADVATAIEFAKPLLYRAAYALSHGEAGVCVRVSQAKLAAGDAALLAARKGIQVHGAMGYTWEVDLQMFMKRAWALDPAWGDRGFHKGRLAAHVLADGAPLGPGQTFEA